MKELDLVPVKICQSLQQTFDFVFVDILDRQIFDFYDTEHENTIDKLKSQKISI